MDFTHDGDSMGYRGGGSDNALTGIMAGSMLNRDDGKTSTMMIVLAVIFFVIIFIIAIIALAMFNKDHKRDYNGGTDIAALLTPLVAAKSMDCNNGYKNGEVDKLEIMQKLEHNEDRAEMRRVQEEQNRQTQSFTNIGFGLSGQLHGVEKTELQNFAKLENQLGMQNMALTQLLQKENNRDIIQGVLAQLAMGFPCGAKC